MDAKAKLTAVLAEQETELQAVQARYKPIIKRLKTKVAQEKRQERKANYRAFLESETERLIRYAISNLPASQPRGSINFYPSLHSSIKARAKTVELPHFGVAKNAQLYFLLPATDWQTKGYLQIRLSTHDNPNRTLAHFDIDRAYRDRLRENVVFDLKSFLKMVRSGLLPPLSEQTEEKVRARSQHWRDML